MNRNFGLKGTVRGRQYRDDTVRGTTIPIRKTASGAYQQIPTNNNNKKGICEGK